MYRKKHSIDKVWDYPSLEVSTGGLRAYPPRIRGALTCLPLSAGAQGPQAQLAPYCSYKLLSVKDLSSGKKQLFQGQVSESTDEPGTSCQRARKCSKYDRTRQKDIDTNLKEFSVTKSGTI